MYRRSLIMSIMTIKRFSFSKKNKYGWHDYFCEEPWCCWLECEICLSRYSLKFQYPKTTILYNFFKLKLLRKDYWACDPDLWISFEMTLWNELYVESSLSSITLIVSGWFHRFSHIRTLAVMYVGLSSMGKLVPVLVSGIAIIIFLINPKWESTSADDNIF